MNRNYLFNKACQGLRRFGQEAIIKDYGLKIGETVYHRTYGEGIISEINDDKITIKFLDEQRSFSLRVLMENNLIIIVN